MLPYLSWPAKSASDKDGRGKLSLVPEINKHQTNIHHTFQLGLAELGKYFGAQKNAWFARSLLCAQSVGHPFGPRTLEPPSLGRRLDRFRHSSPDPVLPVCPDTTFRRRCRMISDGISGLSSGLPQEPV